MSRMGTLRLVRSELMERYGGYHLRVEAGLV